MEQFYVYILASKKNGTLYIGFTNDIERRVFEHKNKNIQGFTSKYDVTHLVYFEIHNSSFEAFTRERQLKKWKREWKIQLIRKDNPNWDDLAENWHIGLNVDGFLLTQEIKIDIIVWAQVKELTFPNQHS